MINVYDSEHVLSVSKTTLLLVYMCGKGQVGRKCYEARKTSQLGLKYLVKLSSAGKENSK